MEGKSSTTIDSLPPEVFRFIAQYLTPKDIDACYNVSRQWRYYFNSSYIWKKCCSIPEKYLIKYRERVLKETKDEEFLKSCVMKQYYELEKCLCRSWSEGRFSVEFTEPSILVPERFRVKFSCDDFGNYWLFIAEGSKLSVFNINESIFQLQCEIEGHDFSSFDVTKDTLIVLKPNYVTVFFFKNPDYKLKLLYSFKFDDDGILSEEQIMNDDSTTLTCHILVNSIIIGYSNSITEDSTSFIHIWNLEAAKKIAVVNTFQSSFKDFINSSKDANSSEDFECRLQLVSGDSRQFLVIVIDDTFGLCQISLYCLDKMDFVTVIAQLQECWDAGCELKNNTIVVWHCLQQETESSETSQVSVYDLSGRCLLNFCSHHSIFGRQFYFTGFEIFENFESMIRVWPINYSKDVKEYDFKVERCGGILCFVPPKFLLLAIYDNKSNYDNMFWKLYNLNTLDVEVWDVESGKKLCVMGKIREKSTYQLPHKFERYIYPGKFIYHSPSIHPSISRLCIYDFENVFVRSNTARLSDI